MCCMSPSGRLGGAGVVEAGDTAGRVIELHRDIIVPVTAITAVLRTNAAVLRATAPPPLPSPNSHHLQCPRLVQLPGDLAFQRRGVGIAVHRVRTRARRVRLVLGCGGFRLLRRVLPGRTCGMRDVGPRFSPPASAVRWNGQNVNFDRRLGARWFLGPSQEKVITQTLDAPYRQTSLL